MYSRVTQIEIDTVRTSVEAALQLFRDQILPQLREQPGYLGVMVFTTPEGKALLTSFWETAEAAEAGSTQGFYAEQLERYVTLFRAPPGRERYEVVLAEMPASPGDAG
jgi:heme-degrading monooxygenase HmoA